MSNTNAVYARIDTNLKENAESILNQLGITPSSAIQMLYSQIVLQKGMPFELRLPTNKQEKPIALGRMSWIRNCKRASTLFRLANNIVQMK